MTIDKLTDLICENWAYRKNDEAWRRKRISGWIKDWLEGKRNYSTGNVKLTKTGILVYKNFIGKEAPIGCFVPVRSENVIVQNFGEQ